LTYQSKQSKAKMCNGLGVCLYAQLVQTKNKQCKSAIILQCYRPHLSDFCFQPLLTQPYNHIIYAGVVKIYIVFFWKCLLYLLILLFLASCSIHLQNGDSQNSDRVVRPKQRQRKRWQCMNTVFALLNVYMCLFIIPS